MIKTHNSRVKTLTVVSVLGLLLLATQAYYSKSTLPRWTITLHAPSFSTGPFQETHSGPLPCQQLPGADDVVFVMRTGSTEIEAKLPMHLNTTARCYKDFIIFSDYGESFGGYHVRDVLAALDQKFVESDPDFGLYLRLREFGRASLKPDELSDQASFEGSKSGKKDNAGWRLDKFKFLPMMNETLKLRPDKKWYVFVETDSYPVYSNLLQWLETLDPNRPVYYGSEVQIGKDLFAHGGSVFVLSRPALEIGAKYYTEHKKELNDFSSRHWAGDCVLGKTLRDAGIPLTYSWPMFQGGHPEKMAYSDVKSGKKLWCTAALSYHHFSPGELEKMWQFEQAWIQYRLDEAKGLEKDRRWSVWRDYSNVLEHRDVFRNFVMPRMREGKKGWWNNLSPTLIENTRGNSFEDCKKLCEAQGDCLQFSSSREGCSISTKEAMYGEESGDTKSGWMVDRIEDWMKKLDKCGGHEGFTHT